MGKTKTKPKQKKKQKTKKKLTELSKKFEMN